MSLRSRSVDVRTPAWRHAGVVARRLSLDAWDSALHNDADADADANADAGGHANGHAGAVHRGLARTA